MAVPSIRFMAWGCLTRFRLTSLTCNSPACTSHNIPLVASAKASNSPPLAPLRDTLAPHENEQGRPASERGSSESDTVGRAADRETAPIQHMRVDHGRAQIAMAEQLLHRTDVVRSYGAGEWMLLEVTALAPAAASEFDQEMPAVTTVVTTEPSLAGAGRRATYVSA